MGVVQFFRTRASVLGLIPSPTASDDAQLAKGFAGLVELVDGVEAVVFLCLGQTAKVKLKGIEGIDDFGLLPAEGFEFSDDGHEDGIFLGEHRGGHETITVVSEVTVTRYLFERSGISPTYPKTAKTNRTKIFLHLSSQRKRLAKI